MDKESKDIPTLPKGFDVLLCINTVTYLKNDEQLPFIKGQLYERKGNKLFLFSSTCYSELYLDLEKENEENLKEFFIVNPTHEQTMLVQESVENDSFMKMLKQLIEKYGKDITLGSCLEKLDQTQKNPSWKDLLYNQFLRGH